MKYCQTTEIFAFYECFCKTVAIYKQFIYFCEDCEDAKIIQWKFQPINSYAEKVRTVLVKIKRDWHLSEIVIYGIFEDSTIHIIKL